MPVKKTAKKAVKSAANKAKEPKKKVPNVGTLLLSRRLQKQIGRVEKLAETAIKGGTPKREAMEKSYAIMRSRNPRMNWRAAKKKAAKKAAKKKV